MVRSLFAVPVIRGSGMCKIGWGCVLKSVAVARSNLMTSQTIDLNKHDAGLIPFPFFSTVFPWFPEVLRKEGSLERMEMEGTPRRLTSLFGVLAARGFPVLWFMGRLTRQRWPTMSRCSLEGCMCWAFSETDLYEN